MRIGRSSWQADKVEPSFSRPKFDIWRLPTDKKIFSPKKTKKLNRVVTGVICIFGLGGLFYGVTDLAMRTSPRIMRTSSLKEFSPAFVYHKNHICNYRGCCMGSSPMHHKRFCNLLWRGSKYYTFESVYPQSSLLWRVIIWLIRLI